MNARLWIGAAVLTLSGLSSAALAQPPSRLRAEPPGERPSHLPVNNGLENVRDPESLLGERLRGSRDLKRQQEMIERFKLNGEMRELAKKLLENPEFVASLKDRFTPDDLERLKRNFDRGGDLARDPELRELVRKGFKDAPLSERDKELFNRWKEKIKDPDGGGRPDGGANGKPPTKQGNGAQPPAGQPPNVRPPRAEKSPWDALPDSSSDWLRKNGKGVLGDLERWLESPRGRTWTNRLTDLARKAGERTRDPAVTERLGRFSKVLPRVSNYLPSRAPNVNPSLPRVGGLMPGTPNVGGAALAGAGQVLIVGVVLAVIAFVLWRSAGWWKQHKEALAASAWRLGGWPVAPGAVATRGDLVRAFDYLAVLLLGPAARTCHHLEVGQQIGAQADLDVDRRREAARELARLYEQARYTPDDEPLSAADLARARRDLCYLAGVPAA